MYNFAVNGRPFRIFPLIFVCAIALAQSPKATYKLASIHVKGLQLYTEDQVVAASGLKIGQSAGDTEFQQAVNKLGETGLFNQLAYTYKYSNGGCELELQASENEKLLPVSFENLVWFSDDELLGLLRSRVPLFRGGVPDRGNLVDTVAQALTQILREHKISGEVQYAAFAPQDGPAESYQYKVTFHAVVLRNIDFPGASAEELPALQAATKTLSGEDYSRTKIRIHERSDFLPVYQSRGYLKAEFGDPKPKIVEQGEQTLVDVNVPVTPGAQYNLTEFQFAGNAVFPADKLREFIHLKSGEPANAVQLADDLDRIQKLYASKGYLFAHVEPMPGIDDSKAAVSYELNVVEGDVYRMGDLSIDGVPEENAKRMAAQWQVKKGDPFDDSYLQRFFSILYRDFGLHQSYEVAPKKQVDRQEKTVSVALHFVPRS